MTAAQVLYGIRNGDLIHIDDVERGLACQCTCPECGHTLVAKKGEVLSHHFAHDADDIECNPTRESLVHRYAKQQVSRLQELRLPGFEVRADVESNDGVAHELYWRHQPYYHLQVKSAQIEADLGSVIPDVLFETSSSRVAVEVYFRHQVPAEKIERLRTQYFLSTLELDLSDIPAEAPCCIINAAIADTNRWKWLHNQHRSYLQAWMAAPLARSTRIFVPEAPRTQPKITFNGVPSRKLAKADSLVPPAKRLVEELRAHSPTNRIARVRPLEDELRIALHCVQIGLMPTRLPPHLMQACEGQGSLGMHPVVWQTGVFAKFCMSGGEFSVKTVEEWVRNSFSDKALETSLSMTQTTNGFTPPAEALYHFLRNLSAQGLLHELRRSKPWESRFVPVAASKAEVLEQLLAHCAARR